MPGTPVPVSGNSSCAGVASGGATGGAVASPPQATRVATTDVATSAGTSAAPFIGTSRTGPRSATPPRVASGAARHGDQLEVAGRRVQSADDDRVDRPGLQVERAVDSGHERLV